MAIIIREIAVKSTTLAEIMENKTKGETEELVKKGVVTINDCEHVMLHKENDEEENVWAFTIEEEPKKFYFAGKILSNVFNDILAECDGDYTELYKAVNEQTLKVKFSNGTTKLGRRVTVVKIL